MCAILCWGAPIERLYSLLRNPIDLDEILLTLILPFTHSDSQVHRQYKFTQTSICAYTLNAPIAD